MSLTDGFLPELQPMDKDIICHEIGHFIAACLIGRGAYVDSIEFYFHLMDANGYNRFMPFADGVISQPTKEDQLIILYGGCVASQVTGRSGKRLSGTDRDKVFAITTASERKEMQNRVKGMLQPFAPLLDEMTEEVTERFNQEIKENPNNAYHRIFKDTLNEWRKRIERYGTHGI